MVISIRRSETKITKPLQLQTCTHTAADQYIHTQTPCIAKWLAPWATAAVGLRLPSQPCLILMQVNPTLTSSSPHWPIISPPLPLALSLFPKHSSHSHFQPSLSPINRNLFLTILPPSCTQTLSFSLFVSSTFDPTFLSPFLSPPQSNLKEISKPIRQQF